MNIATRFLIGVILVSWAANSSALTSQQMEKLAAAIKRAEGGNWDYGIRSIPVHSAIQAHRVCTNSIRLNEQRWIEAGKPGELIPFMALRWCPPSVDLQGHSNWVRNVTFYFNK